MLCPGCSNQSQTEADIAALKQELQLLSDFMRHTGVGALPLLSTSTGADSEQPPGEQQMTSDTARVIQALYEKLKRSQEGAAVVANLLTSEHTRISRV